MVEAFFDKLGESNRTPGQKKAIKTARSILSAAGVEVNPLTLREQQVFQYIADGFDNRQIGEFLDMSERTVETHLYNAFPKLGVGSRGEAMIIGVKKGIIDLDEAARGLNLDLANKLTERTREVLKTMIENQTTDIQKIAEQLSANAKKIRPRTIDAHKTNLLRTLQVPSIDQALIIFMAAEKQGIIRERKKTVLTPQQTLILKLSAKGLSNEEIGQQLSITIRTVETHNATVHKKLGVHNQAEMLIRGVDMGLIDIEECVDEETRLRANDIMTLTKKEQEILEKMIELQSANYQAIGATMNTSPKTVDTHLANLRKKLGLHTTGEILKLYMFYQKMKTALQ